MKYPVNKLCVCEHLVVEKHVMSLITIKNYQFSGYCCSISRKDMKQTIKAAEASHFLFASSPFLLIKKEQYSRHHLLHQFFLCTTNHTSIFMMTLIQPEQLTRTQNTTNPINLLIIAKKNLKEKVKRQSVRIFFYRAHST